MRNLMITLGSVLVAVVLAGPVQAQTGDSYTKSPPSTPQAQTEVKGEVVFAGDPGDPGADTQGALLPLTGGDLMAFGAAGTGLLALAVAMRRVARRHAPTLIG